MTEPPEGVQPAPSAYPPLSQTYAPGVGLPDVYPPPPEYYQQRAQAAPAFVTPGDPPGYEQRPLRDAPTRRRRWFLRPRYSHQPITVLDVMWSFLSAALSFAIYAVIWKWQIGLGLTLLLLVHEMGHFIVIRAKGLPARLPIFIPLVGAFVLTVQSPLSARDDAEIALAGPFAGGLGSVACLIAFWLTGQPVLLAIAIFNVGINLFNLLPISPLDGGRASQVISKKVLAPGLILIGILGLCTFQPLLLALAVVGAIIVLRRPSDAVLLRFYVSRKDRRYITLLYIGLIVALFGVMFFAVDGVSWLRILWLLMAR